jgi:hypothetical protein
MFVKFRIAWRSGPIGRGFIGLLIVGLVIFLSSCALFLMKMERLGIWPLLLMFIGIPVAIAGAAGVRMQVEGSRRRPLD